MEIVDFNRDFISFLDNEDIFLDTGVLLGLLNPFDSWHSTVKSFFDNYVFENDNLILYVHSAIVNELTHLAYKPIEKYAQIMDEYKVSEKEINNSIKTTIDQIYKLIDNDVLILLESTKKSVLNQILFSQPFGSVDALSISLINEYGISFMTVDNRLAEQACRYKNKLLNINRIYYTLPYSRSY